MTDLFWKVSAPGSEWDDEFYRVDLDIADWSQVLTIVELALDRQYDHELEPGIKCSVELVELTKEEQEEIFDNED